MGRVYVFIWEIKGYKLKTIFNLGCDPHLQRAGSVLNHTTFLLPAVPEVTNQQLSFQFCHACCFLDGSPFEASDATTLFTVTGVLIYIIFTIPGTLCRTCFIHNCCLEDDCKMSDYDKLFCNFLTRNSDKLQYFLFGRFRTWKS